MDKNGAPFLGREAAAAGTPGEREGGEGVEKQGKGGLRNHQGHESAGECAR